MDNSQKNIIKTVLKLPSNFFAYLGDLLMTGLSYPSKQELKESIDFLRTLENIQQLGGTIPQGALLEGAYGTEKNLLTCAVSRETQMLLLNINGSEFIELYIGVTIARMRELIEQVWNKATITTMRCGYGKVEKEAFAPVPIGQQARKVPLIPNRVSALGFTLQLPTEEKFSPTPIRLPEIWPVIWVYAKKIGSLI